jgi:hypothetical protein
VHGEASIDSSLATPDRLLSAAGEGLEIAISTNHNFVSDWSPSIDALGLDPWMTSFVGIEFTTLESGHFNSYPLQYPEGPVTHGSFNWFGSPPKELFAGLRKLGAGDSIVVCNHPRDANMGYFSQYGRSSLTGDMIEWGNPKRLAGANGSAFFDDSGNNTIDYGCDAYEIVNGKLQHELHGFRVPTDWPAPCYQPLPSPFDPKTQTDPCNAGGKVLRPPGELEALAPGNLLLVHTPSASPGAERARQCRSGVSRRHRRLVPFVEPGQPLDRVGQQRQPRHARRGAGRAAHVPSSRQRPARGGEC